MARVPLIAFAVAIALATPAAADARLGEPHAARTTDAARRHGPTTAAHAHGQAARPTTDPVALAVRLAERYWRGVPACGSPRIVISPHQLPDASYEATTNPEPSGSVVEMWTEPQSCTITINASVWANWHEDDEFFQWFCDSMTHEVGHLFGHPDGGQTDASSITYPFLNGTSPNFNSVPPCRDVRLDYGAEQIRNEVVVRRGQR
jgi:hypothetical protein